MENEPKFYTAVNTRGARIITVIANSAEQARAMIEYQLNKPGRSGFLRQWTADGRQIAEN